MGYLGKTKLIQMPRVSTQEEVIAKAYSYAEKNHNVPLAEVARQNGLSFHQFYSHINDYGVHWRHKEAAVRVDAKVEYCKNNQNKTLHEISEEMKWPYVALVALLGTRNYHHPDGRVITTKRKSKIALKMMLKGKSQAEIARKLHFGTPLLSKVRVENNIALHSNLSQSQIEEVKRLIKKGLNNNQIYIRTRRAASTVQKIRVENGLSR